MNRRGRFILSIYLVQRLTLGKYWCDWFMGLFVATTSMSYMKCHWMNFPFYQDFRDMSVWVRWRNLDHLTYEERTRAGVFSTRYGLDRHEFVL